MPKSRSDAYAVDQVEHGSESDPLKVANELIITGQPAAALQLLTQYHERFADDPGYLLVCAHAWRDVGDPLRAQHALLGAARLSPADARPLTLLADLLIERGELSRARRVLHKARSIAPDDQVIAQLQGHLDRVAMPDPPDIEEANEEFRLSVIEVENEGDLIAAAQQLDKVRQTPERPARRREVARIAAVVAAVAVLIAVLFTLQHDDTRTVMQAPDVPQVEESAVVTPAPAVQRPAPPNSVASYAVPSMIERPYAPLAPRPARALSIAETLVAQADRYYTRGYPGRAVALYRKALESEPDNASALLGVGRSLIRAGRYQEAIMVASRVLKLEDPTSAGATGRANALYQVGRVHLEQGDRQGTRELLRQATSIDGAPIEAWFYLGEALARENSPASRAAYERFLQAVPKGALADRARRAIR